MQRHRAYRDSQEPAGYQESNAPAAKEKSYGRLGSIKFHYSLGSLSAQNSCLFDPLIFSVLPWQALFFRSPDDPITRSPDGFSSDFAAVLRLSPRRKQSPARHHSPRPA